MDSQNALLINMALFFCQKANFFVWKSASDKQNSTTFLQKMFNAKNASGHEECSFGNPVDKQSINSRRFFAHCPKKIGEKLKEDTSSQSYSIARWNAVLTAQSKNIRTKVKTFRSMWEQENVRFSSECFSAHLVPMYTWKAVLKTLPKNLSQNAVGFLPNIWKLSAFFKCCYGDVEGSFDKLIKKFSTKSRKQFDRRPKKIIIKAFNKS